MKSYEKDLRTTLTSLQKSKLIERGPAVIVQLATPPVAPIFPVPFINAFVAAVVGLVTGTIYAFLLDHIGERRRLVLLRRIEEQEWNRLLAAEFPLPRLEGRA